MAYTVRQLAKISGISVRTLLWYDKVGLLKPAYYGSNGYRYYELTLRTGSCIWTVAKAPAVAAPTTPLYFFQY